MEYLCLIYMDEKTFDGMPDAEWDRVAKEAIASDDRLRASGHYVTSRALDSTRTGKTVRIRGGRLSVTDGPFAETKEQLGGIILIDAKDLDEAVEIAAKIPMAESGSIEVRPILRLGEQRLGKA